MLTSHTAAQEPHTECEISGSDGGECEDGCAVW
jgi:hypothetical protein